MALVHRIPDVRHRIRYVIYSRQEPRQAASYVVTQLARRDGAEIGQDLHDGVVRVGWSVYEGGERSTRKKRTKEKKKYVEEP